MQQFSAKLLYNFTKSLKRDRQESSLRFQHVEFHLPSNCYGIRQFVLCSMRKIQVVW